MFSKMKYVYRIKKLISFFLIKTMQKSDTTMQLSCGSGSIDYRNRTREFRSKSIKRSCIRIFFYFQIKRSDKITNDETPLSLRCPY